MDLTQSITYRTFDFNDAALTAGTGPILSGCKVESVEWPGVQAVGYTEKTARFDGLDASDVYLGGRRVTLAGVLYGATRADLWDRWRALVAATTPTLAYADAPDAWGYVPLVFSEPTGDTDTYASGLIELFMRARPLAQASTVIRDDQTGGEDSRGLSLRWQAPFEMRDPRRYVNTLTEIALTGATSGSGTAANAGNYPTPMTIILVSPAGGDQTFHLEGPGGVDITVTIPDLTSDSTITIDANERRVRCSVSGVETLQPDYAEFDAERTFPYVPAGGDTYAWSLSSANLSAGSKMTYYPAYA